MTNYDLAAVLFLQLALIILASRMLIYIGIRYFGQTEVVCEMLAGFMLGPSIFGYFLPHLQQSIFPSKILLLADGTTMTNPSMLLLFVISQIGLIIYMFLTGLEFNTKIVSKKIASVATISISGIIIPFIMGGIFISLIDSKGLISDGISSSIAIIYFGSAIAITAFPVLARIIDEKGIAHTKMGTLSIACSSIDDAVSWALIAIILTITQKDPAIAIIMIGGTVFYVIFMIFFGKFLRRRLSNHFHENLTPSKQTLAYVLFLLMCCSAAVDKIGLYSAFGAFIVGAIMPKGRFSLDIKEKFISLTSSLLLPVFFVFAGLNADLKLINTFESWLITFIIIFIAITSKFFACSLSARIMGINWKDSTAIGVLMNTRGLMELVILQIGLQHQIITVKLYTMMVLMTLVTTFMTSPLITLLLKKNQSIKGRT